MVCSDKWIHSDYNSSETIAQLNIYEMTYVNNKCTSLKLTFLYRRTTITRKLPTTKEGFILNTSKRTFSAAKDNCGPETGVKARTADWSRRWGRDRQSNTDFTNTRLAATDNMLKANLHLDRFLQHRHSATRTPFIGYRRLFLLFALSSLRPRQTFWS